MSDERGHRPPYRQLCGVRHTPPGSAWSVYGTEDEIGSINLLSADKIVAAAKLVRRGAAFPLNWSLDLPSPALFGRRVVRHRIVDLDPAGLEDVYDDFYPQASSQWDGLSHIRHPEYGFYQGRSREAITGKPGSRLGIEHWAKRGIVGRFVLADLERFRAHQGRAIRHGESDAVTTDEVEACLAVQGVSVGLGDILLLRFGWIRWYEGLSPEMRRSLAASDLFPTPGLANSEQTIEWIWDRGLAAVAADNPAVEVQPFDESRADGFLHYRLIPLLGMALGELFRLDDLAAHCATDGNYDGLFVAAPFNKTGGCGSPANAIALK